MRSLFAYLPAVSFFFFKQKTAYEIRLSLVGSEMCIRDRVYVGASLASLLQGRLTATIVQRSVYRLRQQAQAKLARLPLSYFDRQPRGEVLSRVTNDMDNVAQTLQQTLSQMVTSLLTIIGVLTMMVVISPLLALIAVVTVPVSVAVAGRIGRLAKPQFVKPVSYTHLRAHETKANLVCRL